MIWLGRKEGLCSCKELCRIGSHQNSLLKPGCWGWAIAELRQPAVFEMCRGFLVGQVKWEKFSCLPFSAGGGRIQTWHSLPAAER